MQSSVSKILKQYGLQYLDRFGETMTAQQKKVLRAVMACRTESLGTIRYACPSCGSDHTVPRSCCNRHCPACQQDVAQSWLQKQLGRLLPCSYFLLTFTVPPELLAVLMANPKVGYAALMDAAAESLKQAASNQRHVGSGQLGFFGVLHTWGRDLTYHPHAHFVVAGGAVAQGDAEAHWKPSRTNYFVPERVLSILYRAKLRDALKKAGLFAAVPASAWTRDWTVDSVAVGDGQASMKYLAPYVFHGPVSNWRVTQCCGSQLLEEATLTLQVKPSGQRQYRGMPLTVTEFIRRWLQHVLPSGFHRVRHYGFLNGHSKYSIEEVRWLIALANDQLHYLACGVEFVVAVAAKMMCPQCGSAMICLGFTPPPPVQCTWDSIYRTRAPPDFFSAMTTAS